MKNGLFHKVGAEATLSKIDFEGAPALSKKRVKKAYRDKSLDAKLRRKRARSEVKLLRGGSMAVNVPNILKFDEANSELVLEFIDGQQLKVVIEKNPDLCAEAGKCIRKLHDLGIIHGDLTTSNIIFLQSPKASGLIERVKNKGPLFFIDFGLGFFSKKIEDKATDLVVFKKTFNASHSKVKNGWGKVMEGYSPNKDLIARMEAIEKRARYH